MTDMTMTAFAPAATADAPRFEPGSDRLDFPRALKALRALLRDKENTVAVFEIMRALNGKATAKGYQRLLKSEQGGRLAYQREELMAHLDDDAAMARYAPGTVGASYFAWRTAENLSAAGLAEVSKQGVRNGTMDLQHPVAWFGRRTRDVHDLWHILSGYSRDGLGEACLVAFSFAQTGGLGWALIGLGAATNARKYGGGKEHVAAIWQGYQRGKRAAWLLGEDYHRVLAEPIDIARRRLGITPATLYDAIPPERRDRVAG